MRALKVVGGRRSNAPPLWDLVLLGSMVVLSVSAGVVVSALTRPGPELSSYGDSVAVGALTLGYAGTGAAGVGNVTVTAHPGGLLTVNVTLLGNATRPVALSSTSVGPWSSFALVSVSPLVQPQLVLGPGQAFPVVVTVQALTASPANATVLFFFLEQ